MSLLGSSLVDDRQPEVPVGAALRQGSGLQYDASEQVRLRSSGPLKRLLREASCMTNQISSNFAS